MFIVPSLRQSLSTARGHAQHGLYRALFALGMSALVVGCCAARQREPYRFQLEVEDVPTAFRNGGGMQAESLFIALKLDNLSDQGIRLAKNEPGQNGPSCGLHLAAKLLPDPDLPFLSTTTAGVDQGLRAGRTLKSRQNADENLLFDPHHRAVVQLSKAGPGLLKLQRDVVLSSLTIHGNEAIVYIELAVDWSKVPTQPLALTYSVPLEVSFWYASDDGRQTFPKTLQFRTRLQLVNSRRYVSGFLPVVGGPIEATFDAPGDQPK